MPHSVIAPLHCVCTEKPHVRLLNYLCEAIHSYTRLVILRQPARTDTIVLDNESCVVSADMFSVGNDPQQSILVPLLTCFVTDIYRNPHLPCLP